MKETQIKCDRCSKMFGSSEWPTVEFREVRPIEIILRAVIRGNPSVSLDDVDLCPECRKSFREWFNRS